MTETALVDAPNLETGLRADVNTQLVASLAAATREIAQVGRQFDLSTATQSAPPIAIDVLPLFTGFSENAGKCLLEVEDIVSCAG